MWAVIRIYTVLINKFLKRSPSQASLLLQKQLKDHCKHPVDGFSAEQTNTLHRCIGVEVQQHTSIVNPRNWI
ncbi:hypothetical protein HAX54_049873 [Datura stramonium]|uniref:Uncharacterized protein n=1 Tax=Datura stramonium TaxID=4076 RepID=A0ABS8SW35_DATST|nr:hypothetical protein [Datura stramonium]